MATAPAWHGAGSSGSSNGGKTQSLAAVHLAAARTWIPGSQPHGLAKSGTAAGGKSLPGTPKRCCEAASRFPLHQMAVLSMRAAPSVMTQGRAEVLQTAASNGLKKLMYRRYKLLRFLHSLKIRHRLEMSTACDSMAPTHGASQHESGKAGHVQGGGMHIGPAGEPTCSISKAHCMGSASSPGYPPSILPNLCPWPTHYSVW